MSVNAASQPSTSATRAGDDIGRRTRAQRARRSLRGTRLTSRNAFADALARPWSLAFQMLVMIVNDATWIVFWILFFRKVGTMRGWTADEVIVLQAFLTFSGGMVLGFFRNIRYLSSMIINGELDATLALPVNPLVHVLVKQIGPLSLGDIAFGLVLFIVAERPSPGRLALFGVLGLLSAGVVMGFLILAGSTAFFTGRAEFGEFSFHTIVLLGSYPVDIFSGVARVMMFTVVPAAFVATIPARLVVDFSWANAASLAAVSALFLSAGAVAFHAGLRRYTSGALWTRA